MSGYLLDTNVISAFAPGKTPVAATVAAWFESRADSLFLSVISLVEIEAGIGKLHRTGAVRRAEALAIWLDRLIEFYGERVLPLDTAVGRLTGVLSERMKAAGHNPGLPDIAIAATADLHRLFILTRNVKHFQPLGVGLFDPFATKAPD